MLSEQERAILAVESRFWRHAAVKEDHVREHLGLSPIRYYQAVNALLARPEAWEYAPATCARLSAIRGRLRLRRMASTRSASRRGVE